ncbi:MAG TPA: hypothetical protein VFU11_04150 [Solirubrobacterales bacterium]|nr:hypothetical protein [Solirubrobacterales bacterium]
MFELLRLPKPGNVSQALATLASKGKVVRRRSGKTWSLTPEGRTMASQLMENLDVTAVEAEIALVGSAELQQAQHPLIPPELAPVRWATPIGRLLDRFPFDANVFCMTRFPKDEKESELPDPVRDVIVAARETLDARGLKMHLASDRQADDELFGNIAAHMWACKYGIGLFETRFGEEFNDNLQIEVGAMLMTGRRVVLLKDRDTPDMPTDFVGHIYRGVDFDDPPSIAQELDAWITEDLGI